MHRRDASYWIDRLGLARHPEGGYYRETYRSVGTIPGRLLGKGFGGKRAFCTAIYFLLKGGQVSRLHRIGSDEVWHFHDGEPLGIVSINHVGDLATVWLGRNPDKGEVLQAVVKAGCWFGATVAGSGAFSLVGCTVAPGFDFRDFELGDRETLCRLYPQHGKIIRKLT